MSHAPAQAKIQALLSDFKLQASSATWHVLFLVKPPASARHCICRQILFTIH
ncbi:hypothetical protein CY34DRAFT_810012 [Suillus luteus UH-Slu-Lm8-n1]|uniref:Unplaced genomic scaffold CY34scaffold_298, whole genome shotgun sequence n=1 Tax=Suillus luteus UH-Slu-Lm8-n1 TaxID=930992 RepID=A0A0D0AI27_9AGAM|nr:hypothetical protein CY34DRAFT_810012 [Suillus luteus UH-Slu-Lm8-n1]